MDSRRQGSPHVTALSGKMQSLDSGLAISFEAEKVDHVQQLRWQKRDSQMKDAVTKTDGGHQSLDCLG
jgi:hypothetical protein